MSVIIAKNQTAGILAVNDLSITNQEIPASGQVTLTDFATVTEVQDSLDLRAHVVAGDVLLSLDGVDLDQVQSGNLLDTVIYTVTPTSVDRGLLARSGQTKLSESRNDLILSFKDELADSNAAYTVKARFLFRGTAALGVPTSIKLIAGVEDATKTGDVRIQDVTNGQTIAELKGIDDLAPTIRDMGSLGTLPSGEAIWEIQMRVPKATGGENVLVYCVAVLF